MNIVIFSATPLALFVANKLSLEEHNVIIVDFDSTHLEKVGQTYDVGTRVCSKRNWDVFEELLEHKPDIILCMHDQDEVNLVLSDLCKGMGYPFSIVKVEKNIYLDQTKVNYERLFRVDHFLAPNLLAAFDIFEKIINPAALHLETFAHGSVQMRSFIVSDSWHHEETLADLPLPKDVRISLIKRGDAILFPHGEDVIKPGDEVIIVGGIDAILYEVPVFFKLMEKRIESVFIIGASSIGMELAYLLEKANIHVRIVDQNREQCAKIARQLDRADVLHHDVLDMDFLLMEQVHLTDAVVLATSADELNLLTAGLAKKAGAQNIITLVSSKHIKSEIEGLQSIQEVSPFTSMTHRINAIIQQRSLVSIANIYENQAEIVEIKVSKKAKTIGIRLSELNTVFPKEFLILAIESKGYLQIASGNSVLCPGDIVIAITNEKNRTKMEQLF